MAYPPERPTQMPCPARGCEEGQIVTREETATGYRVGRRTCGFCGGVGLVTPEKRAAYKSLERLKTP
jgi:hypothetical protein